MSNSRACRGRGARTFAKLTESDSEPERVPRGLLRKCACAAPTSMLSAAVFLARSCPRPLRRPETAPALHLARVTGSSSVYSAAALCCISNTPALRGPGSLPRRVDRSRNDTEFAVLMILRYSQNLQRLEQFFHPLPTFIPPLSRLPPTPTNA